MHVTMGNPSGVYYMVYYLNLGSIRYVIYYLNLGSISGDSSEL